jgi:hypothetical protein
VRLSDHNQPFGFGKWQREEFERADAEIGRMPRKGDDNLSVEERRFLALLSRLIEDYEGR